MRKPEATTEAIRYSIQYAPLILMKALAIAWILSDLERECWSRVEIQRKIPAIGNQISVTSATSPPFTPSAMRELRDCSLKFWTTNVYAKTPSVRSWLMLEKKK